jgi:hypothetical protein
MCSVGSPKSLVFLKETCVFFLKNSGFLSTTCVLSTLYFKNPYGFSVRIRNTSPQGHFATKIIIRERMVFLKETCVVFLKNPCFLSTLCFLSTTCFENPYGFSVRIRNTSPQGHFATKIIILGGKLAKSWAYSYKNPIHHGGNNPGVFGTGNIRRDWSSRVPHYLPFIMEGVFLRTVASFRRDFEQNDNFGGEIPLRGCVSDSDRKSVWVFKTSC